MEDTTPPVVKIELNLPLVSLAGTHLAEAVATAATAYGALRWEVEALCDPALAQLYLHITRRKPANRRDNESVVNHQSANGG